HYSRNDHQWSGKAKAYVSCPVESVFDGKSGKDLWPKGGGLSSFPEGSIKPGPAMYIDGPYLNAVGLAYRPLVFRVLVDHRPDSLKLTGRKLVLEGKPCLELEVSPGGGAVQRLWVDPAMDYAVVRSLLMVHERIITKMDIGYVKGAGGDILLDRWE